MPTGAARPRQAGPSFQRSINAALGAAVLRWQHPTRGLLPPAEFLTVAEGSSLIMGIGARVLEEACAQATGCARGRPLAMAINVSLRPIITGSFRAALT
jgi:EAL domain-containing protein (putative c-di-GMP-specific phosphodiesterase class I)